MRIQNLQILITHCIWWRRLLVGFRVIQASSNNPKTSLPKLWYFIHIIANFQISWKGPPPTSLPLTRTTELHQQFLSNYIHNDGTAYEGGWESFFFLKKAVLNSRSRSESGDGSTASPTMSCTPPPDQWTPFQRFGQSAGFFFYPLSKGWLPGRRTPFWSDPVHNKQPPSPRKLSVGGGG